MAPTWLRRTGRAAGGQHPGGALGIHLVYALVTAAVFKALSPKA